MQSFCSKYEDGLRFQVRAISESSSYSSNGSISSLHFDNKDKESFINQCMKLLPDDEYKQHLKDLYSKEYDLRELIMEYKIQIHNHCNNKIKIQERIFKIKNSWWRKYFNKYKIELNNLYRYLEITNSEIDKFRELKKQKFTSKEKIKQSIEMYFSY